MKKNYMVALVAILTLGVGGAVYFTPSNQATGAIKGPGLKEVARLPACIEQEIYTSVGTGDAEFDRLYNLIAAARLDGCKYWISAADSSVSSVVKCTGPDLNTIEIGNQRDRGITCYSPTAKATLTMSRTPGVKTLANFFITYDTTASFGKMVRSDEGGQIQVRRLAQ